MSDRPNSRRGHALERLERILQANRRGKGLGIYSICSANRFVLEAGMLQAKRDGSLLLIEATSNQVNQFRGYTGQTPRDFVRFVRGIAQSMKMPWRDVILGGDHLGPHVWRNTSSKGAMEKACELVREYVKAGFTKIHLDASMPCADDVVKPNQPLPDEIVSARAAELCEAAESAYSTMRGLGVPPRYVIGTEVPIPGGEQLGASAPEVTRTENLVTTLDIAKEAFLRRGLRDTWKRVIAVVVQPGVEFGDTSVFHYDARKAKSLSGFCTGNWSGVYEAHSTDYQTKRSLRKMVEDHFAILKVGPWLTFAFREAVVALETIEQELLPMRRSVVPSRVQESLEKAMLENPVYWKSYYQGNKHELQFARKFSYSDRVRYYWPTPAVSEAVGHLMNNLTANPAPLSLLSQYLPGEAEQVRAGQLANRPEDLIRHKILEVIDQYVFACGMQPENEAAC
jgi:D-tagatose-1,6-bisphosphate aldolase subunit GatZ/KbaZ